MTDGLRMNDRYAADVRDELVKLVDASAGRVSAAPAADVVSRSRRDGLRVVVSVVIALAFIVPITFWAIQGRISLPAARATETNVSAGGVYLTTRPESLEGKIVPASAAGQGVLGVSENGCVTVGDYFLVAPAGSTISADGKTLHLEGIGVYALGKKLPVLGGVVSEPLNRKDLPANYRHCGPGSYESDWATHPDNASRRASSRRSSSEELASNVSRAGE